MTIAIYPGTFDPITNGHVDIINRAKNMYDKVVLGVAEKSSKELLFGVEQRVEMVKKAIGPDSNIIVESFDSLVVKFARKQNARAIVRGLRAVSDFEHEFQMAQLNKKLDATIETIFIMASTEYAYLSSSAVKEIAFFGGKVDNLVPETVEHKLKSRYSESGG